jgi:hypothetical protein
MCPHACGQSGVVTMQLQRRQFSTKGTRLGKRAGWALVALLVLFVDARALPNDNQAGATPAAVPPGSAPQRRIVISIPDKKLALVENGRVLKVYSVAVGTLSSPTPSGQVKIINKLAAPTYYNRGHVIPPGKSNPLGSRWLGLSKRGYGIHGTTAPNSIGKAASHGCIRMRKQEVEELFELVRVDDIVEIHAQRDARCVQIFGSNETTAPPPHEKPQPLSVAMVATAGQVGSPGTSTLMRPYPSLAPVADGENRWKASPYSLDGWR